MMAVGAPNLQVAWLALLGAMALALFPTASRRQTIVILGSLAAGIGLFGIVLLSTANAGAAQSVVGYFSLFGGFALIAAVTPDIAPVLVVLLLRVVIRTPWPPSANALAIAVALIALLTCCLQLIKITRTNQTTLLLLGQASIAALTICLGPEGRFAGLVLLILLILTRSAARVTDGPAAALATAGLGGIQPLGVFPGLVLVLLAVSADDPWLLPPLGAALVPIGLASAARRIADFLPRAGVPSLAWVPLVLAVLAGYFTPHGLIEWLRMLTAGPA
jgi:hypothetical protein